MGGLPPSSTGGFLSGVRGVFPWVFPNGATPPDAIRKRPYQYSPNAAENSRLHLHPAILLYQT